MILAADIGATKTLVAVFEATAGRLRPVRERAYASAESPSLEAILDAFLSEERVRVRRCAVGVAGPVVDGRSRLTNLAWSLDERHVARRLGLGRVRILNDLEATAWGVGRLSPRQLASLTPGLRARPGNAVVIAAGTGLGTAILFWDGIRHLPSAGEGGHQGFAPRDEVEIDLLRWFASRHGRASLDRIVAGPGLVAIYRFLAETGRGSESRLMAGRMSQGDPAAAISEAALAGEDALASRALDLFVSLFGAAAGDLALVARATAGVYVAGGIAPKILAKLREGGFMAAFRAKGRLEPLVARIPVRVVLEPRAALFGAAAAAASER